MDVARPGLARDRVGDHLRQLARCRRSSARASAWWMARAIRRANRSSPSESRIRASAFSSHSSRRSRSGRPRPGSIRMSSGPPARKENPRAGSSSCGEETPRSTSAPSTSAMPEPIEHGARIAEVPVQRPSALVPRAAPAPRRARRDPGRAPPPARRRRAALPRGLRRPASRRGSPFPAPARAAPPPPRAGRSGGRTGSFPHHPHPRRGTPTAQVASSTERNSARSRPPFALRMLETYGLRTAISRSPPRARSSRRRATMLRDARVVEVGHLAQVEHDPPASAAARAMV